jgi:ATP-binding cassette, subfamily C, bacterial
VKQIFRIFFTAEETRPFLVLFCLILSGFAEGLSLTAALPTITAIAGGDSGGSSAINTLIRDFVQSFGITPSIGNLTVIVVALFALKSILSFGALAYAGSAVATVSTAMRRRLIAALFNARWSFYAGQRAGHIANVISNDATRAGDGYYLAAQVVSYCVQAVVYAAVGFLVGWQLALAGLIAGTAIGAILSIFVRITRRAGFKQTDRTALLTIYLTDMMSNIKPLKTMHRYDDLVAGMKGILKRLKRTIVARELARQGLNQGSDLLVVLVLGVGVYYAVTVWRVPLPELMVTGFVFFQILTIISKLQKFTQNAVQYEGAYVRAEEMIAAATAQREINTGKKAPTLDKGCRFDRVSFAHEDTPVVTDASFKIPKGSVSVLQGPSGAGKTTLIDLLTGLHQPDSGTIYIDDTPLPEIDIVQWRSSIGYVPQELSLLHSTVRDNIALGDPEITDVQIMEALEQAGAEEFVASLPQGLDSDVGTMGTKLSGGERQRIALARALVVKPRMLILDEVTSALDPDTEAAICRNIASLRDRYTIVAITHRPAWTRIATHLYKVEGGRVSKVDAKAKSRATVRA